MSAVIPPAIRYLGSKFLCAEWIISHFPPHRAIVNFHGSAENRKMVIVWGFVSDTRPMPKGKGEL